MFDWFHKWRLGRNCIEYGFDGAVVYGRVISVYDGDTLKLATKLPHTTRPFIINCRMDGYDAPELRPAKSLPNREEHIRKAIEARNYLMKYLGSIVTVHIKGFDKYGRFLITLTDRNNENINEAMIRLGYGYEYHGGTKSGERDLNSRPKDD